MSVEQLTTGPLPEDPTPVTTPVRGREAELAFAATRLDALARGEGGIVRVEGPAGIGKSRILRDIAASSRQRGIRVFEGAADPDRQFVPLGPLLDGLFSGEDALADAARVRDLAATPGQRFWLLQELGDRLREAARAAPLLILLDDLQWCDDLTLLTFHTVAPGLASHPILWLVAAGGGVLPAVRTTLDRIRRAGAHELTLGPLRDPAVARITEDVLGAAPDADLLRAVRRVEGVPQLLVELLDALREGERVTIENGTVGLTAGPLPVPPLPSVGRRVGRLSDAARALVETAAAVGSPLSVGELARLLDRSPAALITALREALDSDLLVERADRLEFRHQLVGEAVAAGLPHALRHTLRHHAAALSPEAPTARATRPGPPAAPADRPEAPSAPSALPQALTAPADRSQAGEPDSGGRAAAGEALSGDRSAVADDAGAGAPAGTGDARAGDGAETVRLRAAAAELSATAPGSAAELSLAALRLTARDAPERPEIIAETIPLLWQSGQAARARRLGHSGLAAGGLRPGTEARIRLGLARLSSQFDFSDAVRQARAGAELPGIPAPTRARLLALLCLGLAMAGEDRAAEEALAEAREASGTAGDRTAEATLMVVESAVRFARLDWSGAFRQADAAAALAASLGIVHSVWAPEALWHGFLLSVSGRSAEALALAETGVRTARDQGRPAVTRMWLMNRARALLDAGRLTEARADAEAATALTDELGHGNFADVTLLYTLMRVALHTGDRRAARGYAAQARRMRDDSAPRVRTVGSWMLALLADAEGLPDRALSELDEVTAALAEEPAFPAGPVDPADAPVLVRMALRAGAHDRAAPAVRAAERRAVRNPGFTILAATAAHARGLLDNDLAHLLRAVTLYEDCPRPLARASALEDAGRKFAVTRKSEALPYLEKALALYARAGAERDVARVRRRLRASGVRRRPSKAGHDERWPELTASELRVTRLVAQGLTNAQVAAHLSLSPHTVGSHLRRAFTKLDLTSRVELARLTESRDNGE
ncbi:AAA family ATPase [Streptomyces sp. NPDC058667]|uniref:helix-turn-helix transcriptional regulator n=1 Tax=Streptomyces sp. NPDC058667 TaxID=3346588 RepID=UPI00364B69DB